MTEQHIEQHIEQQSEQLVLCQHCKNELPVKEFGICRARPSGRNCYCRVCAMLKMRSHRLRQRQREAAREEVLKTAKPVIDLPLPSRSRNQPLSLEDEIARFVRKVGICTYIEIEREFKAISSKEEIGLCIADLLLHAKTITSTVIGDTRFYLPKPVAPTRRERPRKVETDNSSAFMRFNMPHSNLARRERHHGSV